MLYTGVDLVEVKRITQAVTRWGARFLQRVFTPAELASYRERPLSLAARWAAKEATAKLLGVGISGLGAAGRELANRAVGWTEIEVLSDAHGRPTLTLHGRATTRANELGLTELSISLSHTQEHAIAFVVGMARDTPSNIDAH